MESLDGSDLVALFRTELERCCVRPDESVLIFTDPQFPYPGYASAALAAATMLSRHAFVVIVPSGSEVSERVTSLWATVDVVLGMSSIPWIRNPKHDQALAAGTRTLLIGEQPSSLRRMFPDDSVIARTRAGADLMRAARELRITDDHGTDLTMRKDGRKGHAQFGVADVPGRWDHWPSGLVASTPLEETAAGTLVALPGDAVFRRHITATMRLTLAGGYITEISGGSEAAQLIEYLESFHDPDAYRLSHVGWGTDHRGDWKHFTTGRPPTAPCPDQEGKYGTVTVAIGHNTFDTPDPLSGLGGTNGTLAHVDISLRAKSVYLDGQMIIDHERFLVPELA